MKILVTGGAGYIGSVLVPLLLEKNHIVTVLDSFIYHQTSLAYCCRNTNFNIIRGDVRDKKILSDVLRDVDFIIPLASLTGAPVCDKNPIDAQMINLDSIKLITQLRSKEQKIIFPTTNSGYGIGQDNIYCTEESILKPISLYGRLKTDAESLLLDSGEVVTFRFATVFGMSTRMRFDLLVNDFVQRALSDHAIVLFESHFKRNYLHITDAANAFLFAIENFESLKNTPYNVGLNDANLSKLELCQIIKKHVPNFVFIESDIGRDPDQRNYIVSNDKINKKGFYAKNSIDAGIIELIKGCQIIKRNNLNFSNV
ncbi:MAG: NAD(P)-dependent oxidoreductase [Oligoflexia bacterium]|nr:NAD(P)-dependent oxidoreductase [Oligoflexia bacterium]